MEQNKLIIHPYVRMLFLVGSMAGTILINEPNVLMAFYCFVVLPLFVLGRQFKQHANLMLLGMLPVLLSFILLYILVLGGSSGGWGFITLKMLKLILFTSSIQITLSISSEHLVITFKKWGLKGEALITVLGAFTVWADINYRADKIITARFSRGFIQKRTGFNTAKQFPFVLMPLIIGILRTSTERAESWEQKNIIQLLSRVEIDRIKYPFYLNAFIVTTSIVWMLAGIIYHINF